MNWNKAVIAGAVGGVALVVYDYVIHGVILANTYQSLPEVFRAGANPLWFMALAIILGVVAGLFFAKTRSSFAAGPKGGMMFGLWIGLIGFFATFYTPLTITDFPYYLTWCQGSSVLIGWIVWGAVAGAMYKSA